MKNLGIKISSLVIISAVIAITYIFPALMSGFFLPYMQEDGLVENIGAIFFLSASILLVATYIKRLKTESGSKLKNLWVLALALLFFVACGEEISWGQRIFDFSTPESLMEKNRQHEFNLHNLEQFHGLDENGERKTGLAGWVTMHRMFYVVLFGYIVIVPIIMLFNSMLSRLINNLGIPVIPIWISLLFLMAMFLVKVVQNVFAKDNTDLYHGLVEIMETNIAFVTMLIGLFFYRNRQGDRIASMA